MKKVNLLLFLLIMGSSILKSQQLAFPGADGFGKFVTGGRGGAVYEVTNLNDYGAGSLRAAVAASGKRTVVYRVSGTIQLNSDLNINNPNITIAGQTAPGDGICISNNSISIRTDEVIIRYIRTRLGNETGEQEDALWGRYNKNIIIDHVSASWGTDETLSPYHNDSITVQWCLISESLYKPYPTESNHGFGGIWGGPNASFHHNLIAHHSSRTPRFVSGSGYTDFRNNVIYNWGYQSVYGGEKQHRDKPQYNFTSVNMVANYYKPGPGTRSGDTRYRIVRPSSQNYLADYGEWYVADNYVYGNSVVTADNWRGVQPDDNSQIVKDSIRSDVPFPCIPIEQQTAEEAYWFVLDNTGATLPHRDTIDKRIIQEVINGTATYGTGAYNQKYGFGSTPTGIIDRPTEVGGWPVLNPTAAPADADHDGMPDDWEDAHSLDKNNAADRNTVAPNGYTMLEKYLNSIEFNYCVSEIIYRYVEQNNIKVTWKDKYIGEDAFIILKSTDGGLTFEAIDTVSKNTVEYIDSTTNPDNIPYYCIVAMQDEFQSPCLSVYTKVTDFEIQAPDQIYVGDTTNLMVTFAPENANNQLLEWSLRPEDSDLATILPTGKFIAKDTGIVELTVNSLDSSEISKTISLHIEETVAGNISNSVFTAEILKVFPNPFTDEVNFELKIPDKASVEIKIIDINGVEIDIVTNRIYNPGFYTITWKVCGESNRMLQPGVYFCKITIGNNVLVKKLELFKDY